MAANPNPTPNSILKAVKERDIDECDRLLDDLTRKHRREVEEIHVEALRKAAELTAEHSRQMAISLKDSLLEAARQGLHNFVDGLLTKEAKVNDKNSQGESALMIASSKGHSPVVDLLLSKWSANIHAKDSMGRTATYLASQQGHVKVVDLLLSKGASIDDKTNDGRSSLFTASLNGHVKVVDLLLSKGARINDKTNDGCSSLYIASQEGHVNIVDLLLSKGARINDKANDGRSSLYVASQEGHVKVVDLLLSKGASVNDKANYGCGSLMIASMMGHVNIVELLLSKGANTRDRSIDDLHTSFSLTSSDKIRSVLRKWPTCMGVLVLQELGIYYLIDCSSIIDLHQLIGKEDYTSDT